MHATRRKVSWTRVALPAVVMSIAVGAAALLSPSPAWAQKRDPTTATELFTRGRAAAKKGDFATACPLLEESNRLDPKVGTQLNLADCLEKQKRIASALEIWHAAVQLAESTHDPRAAEAKRRAAALEPRVPRLTITTAAGTPADVSVTRDDVELGSASLGIPIPVEPGAHTVKVTARDHEPREYALNLEEKERKTLEVDVGKKKASKPAEAPPIASASSDGAARASSGGAGRTVGYVLGAVGLAGLVGGVVSGLMLQQKKATINDHCDAQKTCDPQGLDAVEGARTLLTLNTVSWAVGIAGVGAGTLLIIVGGPSKAPADSKANAGLPAAFALQWRGTF